MPVNHAKDAPASTWCTWNPLQQVRTGSYERDDISGAELIESLTTARHFMNTQTISLIYGRGGGDAERGGEGEQRGGDAIVLIPPRLFLVRCLSPGTRVPQGLPTLSAGPHGGIKSP